MTDDELRALVRDAIARHLGPAGERPANATVTTPPWRSHASFAKFLNLPGDDQPGACLIEPGVACNHCGFCKSFGH